MIAQLIANLLQASFHLERKTVIQIIDPLGQPVKSLHRSILKIIEHGLHRFPYYTRRFMLKDGSDNVRYILGYRARDDALNSLKIFFR
jgi:hypothetical protein